MNPVPDTVIWLTVGASMSAAYLLFNWQEYIKNVFLHRDKWFKRLWFTCYLLVIAMIMWPYIQLLDLILDENERFA